MRKFLVALAVATALAVSLVITTVTGVTQFRGLDWSAGSDTAYCGVYWPNADFYCESVPAGLTYTGPAGPIGAGS